jgi:hypothetical protein
MHWILESNLGSLVWQGLLIALSKNWKEDFLGSKYGWGTKKEYLFLYPIDSLT